MHQSLPCRHSPIIYWSMLSYCPLIPRIVLAPHSPPLAPLLSKTSYCAFLSKRGCLVFGPILSSDLNIGARCNKYCFGWKYSPIFWEGLFDIYISTLKSARHGESFGSFCNRADWPSPCVEITQSLNQCLCSLVWKFKKFLSIENLSPGSQSVE